MTDARAIARGDSRRERWLRTYAGAKGIFLEPLPRPASGYYSTVMTDAVRVAIGNRELPLRVLDHAVDVEELEAFRNSAERPPEPRTEAKPLTAGQRAKIISGPASGLRGVVTALRGRHALVSVVVGTRHGGMDDVRSVYVPLAALERIAA